MTCALREKKSVMVVLTEEFLKQSMKEYFVVPQEYTLYHYVHKVTSRQVTRSFKTVFYTSVTSGANYITHALSNLQVRFCNYHMQTVKCAVVNVTQPDPIFVENICRLQVPYMYKFLRDVIFEVFVVNWPSMKFSSLKFHG